MSFISKFPDSETTEENSQKVKKWSLNRITETEMKFKPKYEFFSYNLLLHNDILMATVTIATPVRGCFCDLSQSCEMKTDLWKFGF